MTHVASRIDAGDGVKIKERTVLENHKFFLIPLWLTFPSSILHPMKMDRRYVASEQLSDPDDDFVQASLAERLPQTFMEPRIEFSDWSSSQANSLFHHD